MKIPIRTQKGKMYGMLDVPKFWLYIKDGKDERVIQVPNEGLKLMYITGTNRGEEIRIPPRQSFSLYKSD